MDSRTNAIRRELELATERLNVVLCGSFRRDPAGLRAAYTELKRHYSLIAPASLDFVDPDADFVRLESDGSDSVGDVESRHLAAIARADFVWLHSPGGHVGSSASLELGHARALGVPVFSSAAPSDATLAAFVAVVESPEVVGKALRADPGVGLNALQHYYRRIAARRGWDQESPRDTLLLLTEELGELARAVRKSEGLGRDGGFEGVDAASELADVQLYLVHLANALDIDLAAAVSAKERLNAERHERRTAAA